MKGRGAKILPIKQMLQRLPILYFVQAKASIKSKNLMSEIRQIFYSLYRAKTNLKKVSNYLLRSA